MDRTFHSKVDWWYWLLMAVTAFCCLIFLVSLYDSNDIGCSCHDI